MGGPPVAGEAELQDGNHMKLFKFMDYYDCV